MEDIREWPQPEYDYNTKRLVAIYREGIQAIKAQLDEMLMQGELDDAKFLAQMMAQYEQIVAQLNSDASQWVQDVLTEVYQNGVENGAYAAGASEAVIANISLSRPHRLMANAFIADTQSDLLKMTQYVDAQVRTAVQGAVGQAIRNKAGRGSNNVGELSAQTLRNLRKTFAEAADTVIIDKLGRRWTAERYADMIAYTKQKDAHDEATRIEALDRGVEYGLIVGPSATDACKYHVGRIVRLTEAGDDQYMTLDELKASNQIFHPKCRHRVVPYANPDNLSPRRQATATSQEQAGRAAMDSGKRNPKLDATEGAN